MTTINIAHLYFDLLNLYGENGNVRYLKEKLEEQDLKVNIDKVSLNSKIHFDKYDIFYIGSGSETNFKLVLEDLKQYKDEIKNAINKKKFFISTGNSLDLFGKKILLNNGQELRGLGIFNYESYEVSERIIGEQLYYSNDIEKKIIGFQNRQTILKNFQSNLFNVLAGTGFDKDKNTEGFRNKNFIATYLIGPLLVRNPYFTDYLIKQLMTQLKQKYTEKDFDYSYTAYHEYLNNFDK